MICLRCAIVGCGRVSSAGGYCPQHHEAVVVRGDDPVRLRHATIAKRDKQCPAVAQYDGANCCALIDGHAGEHENTFGTRNGPWGTAEEWHAKHAKNYADPAMIRPADQVPAPADVSVSLSLLPPGIKRPRK